MLATSAKSHSRSIWPEHKDLLDPDVRPYFKIRGEMTVHDGLIYHACRAVVPVSQHNIFKEIIHSSHVGAEGCC